MWPRRTKMLIFKKRTLQGNTFNTFNFFNATSESNSESQEREFMERNPREETQI